MNKLLIVALALAASACSNVELRREGTQGFSYTDATGKAHFVTGSLGYGGWAEKMLKVTIDGQPVITGNLDTQTASGHLSGTFNGSPVIANCNGSGRGMPTLSGLYHSYAVACQIVTDGTPRGTLNF